MVLGLVVNGASSFAFLSAAGRVLEPGLFALVSVLWSALFLVGTGLAVPLELELNRSIAARRARGVDHGPLVRRVAVVATVSGAAVAAALMAAQAPLSASLFRGRSAFVVLLAVGVAGVLALYLARGVLAGSGRYGGYGTLLLGEGLARATPAILLAVAGVREPVAYGLVLALSTFVGAGIPFARPSRRVTFDRGDPPPWRPLVSSLGHLTLTTFLVAVAMNVGTVAVELLAEPSQQELAGVFLSGLVVARLPLFLYQALNAITLPRLSRAAAGGDWAGFRADLRRLFVGLGALTAVGTAASAVLGPWAVEVVFGPELAVLDARDMGLLALSSLLLTVVLTINQAQFALHHQRRSGWPWAVATVAFVATAAWSSQDLLLRVELALAAQALVAVVVGAALLLAELRHPDEGRDELPAL